jgi:hypothetical protein
MQKVRIFGSGNFKAAAGSCSYLILEKSGGILEWLAELIEDVIGMEGARHDFRYKDEGIDDKGRPYVIENSLKEFQDAHSSYESKDARVDMFFGRKRVFMMIMCPPEVRKMITKMLDGTAEFVR